MILFDEIIISLRPITRLYKIKLLKINHQNTQQQSLSRMSNNNMSPTEITSNLIGFLQKKSIFSKSPQKQKRNDKSIEKQFRESNNIRSNKNLVSPIDIKKANIQSPKNEKIKINMNEETRTEQDPDDVDQGRKRPLNQQKSEAEFSSRFKRQIQTQRDKNKPDFSPGESPIRYPKNGKLIQTEGQIQDSYKETNNILKMLNPQSRIKKQEQQLFQAEKNRSNPRQTENTNKTQRRIQQQTWMGLTNHANSFESARIQSAQCLDELSVKLRNEISNVNYKLEVFNSKMSAMITNELRKLRQKIYQIVQIAFEQSQKTIRAFMYQQQEKFGGEMIAMKEHLSKEYLKVEQMKQELRKPGNAWRRVAGELISTELETVIEEKIKRSSTMNVGHWDIGDLGGSKIRALQDLMREIVRIQR